MNGFSASSKITKKNKQYNTIYSSFFVVIGVFDRIFCLFGGEEPPFVGGGHVWPEYPFHVRRILLMDRAAPNFVH